LENIAMLFGDEDGEQGAALVNSIQFRATVLSPAQIASLGGPSASGIPANIPPAPRMSVLISGFGDLTLSWPQNHVGYTLECSPALGPTAQWSTVPGVVNNSAVVTADQNRKFFRLRK